MSAGTQYFRREPRWSEIAVTSNFSFLRGASHPEELVTRAWELGYTGFALVDHETFGGSVRAHVAARQLAAEGVALQRQRFVRADRASQFRLAHGTRVRLSITSDGEEESVRVSSSWRGREERNAEIAPLEVLLYATDRASWGALCRFLTGMRSDVATRDLCNVGDGRGPYCRHMRGDHSGERSTQMTSRDMSHADMPYSDGMTAARSSSIRRSTNWRRNSGISIHALVECIADHPGGKNILGVIVPPHLPSQRFLEATEGLARLMPDRLAVALRRTDDPEGVLAAERACLLADALEIPVAATGDVRMHDAGRRPLLDTLCAIRHGTSVQQMGPRLARNSERRLKSVREMLLRFADRPDAVETSQRFLERASEFSLDELRYEYPDEVVPSGVTPMHYLRELVWKGARERYPRGIPPKVARQFEHEFAIIDDLHYAPYFLTVHEIVAFARSRGILCQGRGAAANSAVCFALGVTAVDPDRIDVLFERFVSRERNEPPDIDIDFEHERREEVIQHIYAKYGRHRAALVSEIISYRGRSAVRDVGRALGFAEDVLSKLAQGIDRWSGGGLGSREEGGIKDRDPVRDTGQFHGHDALHPEVAAQLRESGVDPSAPIARHFVQLVHEIRGFPRHRSQHVGGFVISRGPLAEMVPIENAAMEDRTILEWDKDDIEALGMLKIDVLSLGMLTAVRKAIDLVNGDRAALAAGAEPSVASDAPRPRPDLQMPIPRSSTSPEVEASHDVAATAMQPESLRFHAIPAEDRSTYDMICKADTIGVFQIESRAQMSMLPRLKPRSFYDLVIEVAIVRPGPIQGDMVHPYLRRRNGEEPIIYPDDAIRKVLGKTLGVPLFQEQAMALAVVAAGFTPGQADELRRAIAAWKRSGNQIARFGETLEEGMTSRGYSRTFAKQVFEQIKGFSGYGFPESHAASFALLVYASAWLKRHHPAAFAAALLNSQPMGFYAPAQIVRDAKEHGVAVRGIDIHCSRWDSTLERGPDVVPVLAEKVRSAACEVQACFAWAAPLSERVSASISCDWIDVRGVPSTRKTNAQSFAPVPSDASRHASSTAPLSGSSSAPSYCSTVRIDGGIGAMLAEDRDILEQETLRREGVDDSASNTGINTDFHAELHGAPDVMRAKPSIYLLERFRWTDTRQTNCREQQGHDPSVASVGASVRVQRWEAIDPEGVPWNARDVSETDSASFVRVHGRGRSARPSLEHPVKNPVSRTSRIAEPLCPPSPDPVGDAETRPFSLGISEVSPHARSSFAGEGGQEASHSSRRTEDGHNPCPNSDQKLDHGRRESSFYVPSQPAIRLGLRMVRGLEIDEAQRIVEAVARTGPFRRIADLADAANIGRATLRKLAAADAFSSMGLDRQQAMWQILALRDRARDADGSPAPSLWTPRTPLASSPLAEGVVEGEDIAEAITHGRGASVSLSQNSREPQPDEHEPNLPPIEELSAIAQDLEATGVSLKRHPLACLRERLQRARVVPCGFLRDERRTPSGRRITVAGLVLLRQRPSTAKGIVFMTIEDETGVANLIFRPRVYERLRSAVRHATAICVRGKVERRHGVVHLLVSVARDITRKLEEGGGAAVGRSRDFH